MDAPTDVYLQRLYYEHMKALSERVALHNTIGLRCVVWKQGQDHAARAQNDYQGLLAMVHSSTCLGSLKAGLDCVIIHKLAPPKNLWVATSFLPFLYAYKSKPQGFSKCVYAGVVLQPCAHLRRKPCRHV